MEINKFRPQSISKSYIIKQRLRIGRVGNYNLQTRIDWYPAGWDKRRQQFARRFARLHYLACHAPRPIQKQWQAAYRMFMNKHFGNAGNASVRYLNTWSCHSWL
jgi:hypothetical protein